VSLPFSQTWKKKSDKVGSEGKNELVIILRESSISLMMQPLVGSSGDLVQGLG
jgi:hypothetical protein